MSTAVGDSSSLIVKKSNLRTPSSTNITNTNIATTSLPSRSPSTASVTDKRINCKRTVSYVSILTTEALERIAFYSVSSNLVLFLNTYPYRWESYNAASASFFFLGISFVMALFSGWLADSFVGKFKMIVIGFCVYISAYVFLILLTPHQLPHTPDICHIINRSDLSLNESFRDPEEEILISQLFSKTSHPHAKVTKIYNEKCSGLVFVILGFVALGVGSVKSNITPFGGDQTRSASFESRRRFFNMFYWCTNLGSFLALGPIAYVQQEISFFIGYVVAFCCLSGALLTFLMGCTSYVKKPSGGSTLTDVGRVIIASIKSRRGVPRGFACLQSNMPKPTCLDHAKLKYGGRYRDNMVDDVKVMLKITCVFLFMIPYWLVYFQMETTFLIQGLHMKLSISDSLRPQIVAVWLSLFDPILLIFLIPFLDRVVYPYLDRAGYHFSMLKRITFGMVFTIAAMLVAGGVETRRLQKFWPYPDPLRNASINQVIGNDTYQAADFTVFWQIPQYALLGISEVFTSVAGLEFAYSQAPKSMKGIIMGIFFFCSGAGSLLGISTIDIFHDIWFFGTDHGNINCRLPCLSDPKAVCHFCHLDYYFYTLAAFQAVFLLVFVLVVWVLDFRDEYDRVILRSDSTEAESRKTKTYRTFDDTISQ